MFNDWTGIQGRWDGKVQFNTGYVDYGTGRECAMDYKINMSRLCEGGRWERKEEKYGMKNTVRGSNAVIRMIEWGLGREFEMPTRKTCCGGKSE